MCSGLPPLCRELSSHGGVKILDRSGADQSPVALCPLPAPLRRHIGVATRRSASSLPLVVAIAAWSTAALANEVHDLDDDPEGHRDKTMYQITISGPEDQSAMAAAQTMDLEYIDMMSRHHAGAQTMSEDYISDERGTNPILRKLSDAIITNQGFELAILALARESVSRPPTILDFGLRPHRHPRTGCRWP